MSKAQEIKALTNDTVVADKLCKQFAYDVIQDWENGRTIWRFDDESVLVFDAVSFWVE